MTALVGKFTVSDHLACAPLSQYPCSAIRELVAAQSVNVCAVLDHALLGTDALSVITQMPPLQTCTS
jgi:hypothetical protein